MATHSRIKKTLFAILGVIVLLPYLVYRFLSLGVPTVAMEPNIKAGDQILTNPFAYSGNIPSRGDIIVFLDPRKQETKYVKRVVGLPGERIRIKNLTLIVNDVALKKVPSEQRDVLGNMKDRKEIKNLFVESLEGKEYFVLYNKEPHRFLSADWPADGSNFKVPDGEVFVLGDNRDNSADSRIWGSVPLELIKGQVSAILWNSR